MAGSPPFRPAPANRRVGFRRIPAKHPEVRELQRAVEQAIADINARLVESYFHALPIGVPFPFMSALFPAGFELGEKFVPCDGRTISSRASPLHGRAITTITDQLGASGLEWWVRILD